jgi:tetratricopeptide (TPR) repeat protein
LKGVPAAKQFMAAAPTANHVSPGTLVIQHRPSAGPSPSVAAFVAALQKQGFDKAIDTYAAYTRMHPGFQLPNDTFEAWFSSLSDLARTSDAINICLLWTHVSPKSVDAWTDLGAAYEIAGQPEEAIASYRKILEIDPHNRIAEGRIKSLGLLRG